MKRICLFLVIIISLVSCVGKTTSTKTITNQTQETVTNQTQPRTAYSYDEGVIYLYDSNHKAEVNGISGEWSYCNDKNVAVHSNSLKPYYYVNYGNNNIAVISVAKGMIYFGTERSAAENEKKIQLWHEYRKSRE